MPFSNHTFSFWNQIDNIKVFPLFWTILDSWKISSTSVWSRKISLFKQNNFLLSNLLSRVPSFYIRTKSRLKNCVTIMHLLQYKTNLFIRLCSWGRNLRKLKNIHLGKPPLISKNFFDSLTFVYTRLHSSRSVYNPLDSSSDSSALVYIRLVTRLHSSSLV